MLYTYHFNVEEIIIKFRESLKSISEHHYNVSEVIRMVINTYRDNAQDAIHYIGRYCMYYCETSNDPATETQIMFNAIMMLRVELFDMLNKFTLTNKQNQTTYPITNNISITYTGLSIPQFPYKLRFKSLKDVHLLIEVEIENHDSASI